MLHAVIRSIGHTLASTHHINIRCHDLFISLFLRKLTSEGEIVLSVIDIIREVSICLTATLDPNHHQGR